MRSQDLLYLDVLDFLTFMVRRFEHSQNTVLSRVLTTCLELTTIKGSSATGGEEEGPVKELELGRYVNLWLNLQNSVSALMDSTSADNTDTQGIRQSIEKKEGLFRKNMMGKRVNFAARCGTRGI